MDDLEETEFELILSQDGKKIIHRFLTVHKTFNGFHLAALLEQTYEAEIDRQLHVTERH